MPPLAVHREVLETVGSGQSSVNRWEPSVAAGADLLPVPSVLYQNAEIVIDGSDGSQPGKVIRSANLSSRLDDQGRLIQEHLSYHSETGIYTEHERVTSFDWDEDGNWAKVGSDGDPDASSERRVQFTPEIVQVTKSDKVYQVRKSLRKEGGVFWVVNMWDADGYHMITESVGSEGRLTKAEHNTRGSVGKRDLLFGMTRTERFEYKYSDSGQLTRETKKVIYDGTKDDHVEDDPSEVEVTDFRYLPGGYVSYVTVLGDGIEIRRGIRHYDEEGRLISDEVEENLPGEGRQRRIGQTAMSYSQIEEPFHMSVW